MSGDHSIIPPSSTLRRIQCRGSAMMEMMFPGPVNEDDVKEAEDGEASHEVGAAIIEAATRGEIADIIPAGNDPASNGIPITDEMFDCAKMYADDVIAIMRKTGCFVPNVEQRVTIPRIHEQSYGTPDSWLFSPAQMTLYLWDYKFGRRVVEVFENPQLLEYLCGILDEITNGNGLVDQQITVVMTIVQPRAFHRDGPIRRWTINAADCRAYFNWLSSVEHEALGDNPVCRTGPECRDCTARGHCETLQNSNYYSMSFVGTIGASTLDAESLSVELRLVNRLYDEVRARKSGLEAQAEAVIKNGSGVKGFAIESGRSSKKWDSPKESVYLLGEMMGVDLRKNEPITPPQAIAAGVDESLIAGYVKNQPGAPRLVESHQTAAYAVFSRGKLNDRE